MRRWTNGCAYLLKGEKLDAEEKRTTATLIATGEELRRQE